VSRAVVWLHDVEGFTHQEIAELMGKTESFSKSQLSRAYQRLRRMLEAEASATARRELDQPVLRHC
jgi:RNA polymerase sigma-70 factor (ECF subfamily)